MKNHRIKHPYPLTILAVTSVLAVLYFGLNPRTWPISNQVKWLPETKALQFVEPSTAFVEDISPVLHEKTSTEFTIALKLSPGNVRKNGYRPILTIHNGLDSQQIALWHWGASLIIMNGDDYDNSKKWPRLVAKDALDPGQPCFISIVSGRNRSQLFINGDLAAEDKNWKLTIPNRKKFLYLTLGNSIYGKDGWDGIIYDLAIYNKALTIKEIYSLNNQLKNESPYFVRKTLNPSLHYTFGTVKDNTINDLSGNNLHLQLPVHSVVLKFVFLSLPLNELTLNRSLMLDITINLVGFFFVGAILFLWLLSTVILGKRNAALITVAICFLLSLSIEILQAWIPARDSSLLDLLLNTLGAGAGIVVVSIVQSYRLLASDVRILTKKESADDDLGQRPAPSVKD